MTIMLSSLLAIQLLTFFKLLSIEARIKRVERDLDYRFRSHFGELNFSLMDMRSELLEYDAVNNDELTAIREKLNELEKQIANGKVSD